MSKEAVEIITRTQGLHPEDAIKQFTTEPVDELASVYVLNDLKTSMQSALNYDLTHLVELDFRYRYANAGDIAINIRGSPNRGKSNALLSYGLLWSKITKVPYYMSNIVWTLPELNLLLKGLKVRYKRDAEGKVEMYLESFNLEPGSSVSLDEAGDTLQAGKLSWTIQGQTASIEARIRAKQVGRFCAGVREILHQAYYSMYAVQRNPVRRECILLVYVPASTPTWLGFVRVPYVPQEIFAAYNKPKLESIDAYGHSSGQGKISQLISFFAKELWGNREFQKLPLKPNNRRVLWLENSERYAIFPTTRYIEELYKLSLNKELHDELTTQDSYKVLTRKEYQQGAVDDGSVKEGSQKVLLNPRFVDKIEDEEEKDDESGVDDDGTA